MTQASGSNAWYARGEVITMAISTSAPGTKFPSVMPPEMARAMFDEEARIVTGFSGEEFLRRWEAGEFSEIEDTPEGRALSYLIMLIPFGQQDS